LRVAGKLVVGCGVCVAESGFLGPLLREELSLLQPSGPLQLALWLLENMLRVARILKPVLVSQPSRSYAASFSSSSIDPSALTIKKTAAPKLKPANDHSLVFGAQFADHMLEVDWKRDKGFGPPRIVPHHKLEIDPAAPALHYSVQAFEGMKAYKDSQGKIRLFRPDKNMQRFNDSCERLAVTSLDREGLLKCIKELLKVDSDWVPEKEGYSLYLRPTMIATDPALGVHPSTEALIYCITSPVGPYFKDGFKPVKILAETTFKRAWPGGTGCNKVGGNYAPGLLPQQMANKAGYSQVLWLFGEDDYVTEVGSMNIFFLWETPSGKIELVTAPLDGTILPGVTRDSILELAREWGEFEVTERPFTMPEVAAAWKEGRLREAFGAGTAAVIAPINGIAYKGEEMNISCGEDGNAGPLAARLYKEITDIQAGKKSFRDWSVLID